MCGRLHWGRCDTRPRAPSRCVGWIVQEPARTCAAATGTAAGAVTPLATPPPSSSMIAYRSLNIRHTGCIRITASRARLRTRPPCREQGTSICTVVFKHRTIRNARTTRLEEKGQLEKKRACRGLQHAPSCGPCTELKNVWSAVADVYQMSPPVAH